MYHQIMVEEFNDQEKTTNKSDTLVNGLWWGVVVKNGEFTQYDYEIY